MKKIIIKSKERWMEINNPHNVGVGEEVILDGRGKVTILDLTEHNMFATVKDESSRWNVMTRRLRKQK